MTDRCIPLVGVSLLSSLPSRHPMVTGDLESAESAVYVVFGDGGGRSRTLYFPLFASVNHQLLPFHHLYLVQVIMIHE